MVAFGPNKDLRWYGYLSNQALYLSIILSVWHVSIVLRSSYCDNIALVLLDWRKLLEFSVDYENQIVNYYVPLLSDTCADELLLGISASTWLVWLSRIVVL